MPRNEKKLLKLNYHVGMRIYSYKLNLDKHAVEPEKAEIAFQKEQPHQEVS